MGNLKGVAIQDIKHYLKQQRLEDKFISQLSPAAQTVYRKAIPVTWLPLTEVLEIIEKAAAIIHPAQTKGVYQLGYDGCRAAVPVIYQMFIKIPTPGFVVSKAPAMWNTYWDMGEVGVEESTDFSVVFKITGAADLSPLLKEFVLGYLHGMLSMTSAKEIHTADMGVNNASWIITASWK